MILRWMVTKTKTAVWGGYDRTKTTKSQYGLPVAYRKSTKFDLEYSSHQRKPLKKQSKTGYLKQGINILKRVLGAGESFFNNCRWVTYSNRYLNSEMNLSEYKRQGIHLTKCWVNHTEHWQKKKKKKKKRKIGNYYGTEILGMMDYQPRDTIYYWILEIKRRKPLKQTRRF